MLAYLLWHRPRPGVDVAGYERDLVEFLRLVAEARPDGFLGCGSSRIEGATWSAPDGAGYEDWYLLEGSFGMDLLNDAAVSGPCRAPHRRVAAAATGT
ncbi:MAG: hypothetical protein ACREPA_01910, partial [Candidatus Dormibacteraceae bacterium]